MSDVATSRSADAASEAGTTRTTAGIAGREAAGGEPAGVAVGPGEPANELAQIAVFDNRRLDPRLACGVFGFIVGPKSIFGVVVPHVFSF